MSQQHIEEIENKIFGELPFKAKAKDIKLIIEYAKEQAERVQELEDIKNMYSEHALGKYRQNNNLQAENETLSSALHDARHEVRVLKNKAENLERDFMYYFKLANKLDHQNKRYREFLENIRTVKYDDEFNPYAYMMLEIIEWAEEALEGEE